VKAILIQEKVMRTPLLFGSVLAVGLALGLQAPAAHAQEMACHMHFNLRGWSVIYKHAEGRGDIRCDNGETAPVNITINGGGLTAGRWRIDDGYGELTRLHHLHDAFGSYASLNADAGVVRSAGAQVLTKGDVSLELHGTGQGVNLGVDVDKFTISPVRW
jgi:hypothetical protein